MAPRTSEGRELLADQLNWQLAEYKKGRAKGLFGQAVKNIFGYSQHGIQINSTINQRERFNAHLCGMRRSCLTAHPLSGGSG
jgi:hypothetical protein